MRAVFVKRASPAKLVIAETDDARQGMNHVLIDVAVFALNPGEIRMLDFYDEGSRIGWDFAGVVAEPAASGQGPQRGARVVGTTQGYSWAERITVPIEQTAVVPDDVTFEEAVCLPVPGATAFFALRKGGLGYRKRLLVTGAAGAVGQYAVQLGQQCGYVVSAAVRRENQVPLVTCHDVQDVRVGEWVQAFLNDEDRFDLVIDVIGPEVAPHVAHILAPLGRYVVLSANTENPLTLPVAPMLSKNASTHIINLFSEATAGEETLSTVLSRLLEGLATGYVTVPMGQIYPWDEIDEVARRYLASSNRSKPVLKVNGHDT